MTGQDSKNTGTAPPGRPAKGLPARGVHDAYRPIRECATRRYEFEWR
jgi:hypothetical protein